MFGWFIAVGGIRSIQRAAFRIHLPAVSVTSSAEKVIISWALVSQVVCLFVCLEDYGEKCSTDFHKIRSKCDRYVSRNEPLDCSDNPYHVILGSD